MDGIRFGQWFHEQRHSSGFASQRALADKVRQDAGLTDVSEAFLARLESGQLAYPFRGAVRQRVLRMTGYLCHTPRELQHYLRAAALTDLTEAETFQITRLRQQLARQPARKMLVLPAQGPILPGHQSKVEYLSALLREQRGGVYLITGLPGSGKSALISALVYHMLQEKQAQHFADGILYFSCGGYHGWIGLAALCEQILRLFDPRPTQRHTFTRPYAQEPFPHSEREPSTAEQAYITNLINQLRQKLKSYSLLLVLDDVRAAFPLRQLAELLPGRAAAAHIEQSEGPAPTTMLVTSRSMFTNAFVTHHLLLNALDAVQQATAYFASLLGYTLDQEEERQIGHLCEEVGYHPLTIEGLAALCKAGMPVALLTASPLDALLKSILEADYDVRTRLDGAFQVLDGNMRKAFTLLARMGTSTVSPGHVAAFGESENRGLILTSGISSPHSARLNEDRGSAEALPARRALILSQFVRHSLLTLRSASPHAPLASETQVSNHAGDMLGRDSRRVSYQMHPLLRVYGAQYLTQLSAEEYRASQRNITSYALTYVEQYQGVIGQLLQERTLLYHAFLLALEQQNHEEVIRLVDGLTPISCRLPSREDGDFLFRQGIQASQQSHNHTRQASFMAASGWLYCQRGEFERARHIWEETLEMTRHLRIQVWQPLSGLAHIAHLQQQMEQAVSYIKEYESHCQELGAELALLAAQVRRATFLRIQGKKDQAHAVLSAVLQASLLQERRGDKQEHALLELQARIELGRVCGEYRTAQQFTWDLANWLSQQEEPYSLAYILFNQAQFAQEKGHLDDLMVMAEMMIQATREIEAPFFRAYGTQLQRIALEERAGVSSLSLRAIRKTPEKK